MPATISAQSVLNTYIATIKPPCTGTKPKTVEGGNSAPMISVFLPTTPNPTTGYFIMLPEDRVVTSDLTVEQGFKLLMSSGIVRPPGQVVVDQAAFGPGDDVDGDLVPMVVTRAQAEALAAQAKAVSEASL